MQYQVPQFIDTEDKIVGPFTLKQFAYVGIACLISAFFYFLVQTWLFFIIAIIFIGGSLALSFLKINGRPLIKIAISAATFYWKPQTYVWKPDHPLIEQKPTPHEESTVKNIEPEKAYVAPATPITPIEPIAPANAPRAIQYPSAVSASMAADAQAQPSARPALTLAAIAAGDFLHKSWESLQTGTPVHKKSDRQFVEDKMADRYEIFKRTGGDRVAARRVDYR
jgi:hypothetical protein